MSAASLKADGTGSFRQKQLFERCRNARVLRTLMFDHDLKTSPRGHTPCQEQCNASHPVHMSTTVVMAKPAGPAQQYKLVLNPAWWAQHARSATVTSCMSLNTTH